MIACHDTMMSRKTNNVQLMMVKRFLVLISLLKLYLIKMDLRQKTQVLNLPTLNNMLRKFQYLSLQDIFQRFRLLPAQARSRMVKLLQELLLSQKIIFKQVLKMM